MLLDSIKSPEDVKKLNYEDLEILSEEIRKEIIHVTSENGGHVGPNLGVVELTIALHRIFDTPKDNIQFDVSHQSYVHKLLTGRNGKAFRTLRQGDGVCGFSNRKESPHDSFGAGHAGTCLSASLGMAVARDLNGGDEHVVAVCGDAAFTCGHTMEALNNIASSTKRLIVILNDNEWSISKNVGALSKSFNELITNPIYNKIHTDVESLLAKIPGGESLIKMGSKAKKEANEEQLTPKKKKELSKEEKEYKSLRKKIQEKLIKFAILLIALISLVHVVEITTNKNLERNYEMHH